jgi:beta-1,2-mannobiose phosphorylase / 1,2-beta-oligomannan phosphorylase
MADLARRFEANPLISPQNVKPSRENLTVECLLNPGVFRFQGKIWLLMRVAERPPQRTGTISTPILDPSSSSGMRVLECHLEDSDLIYTDPRVFFYQGVCYLTTLSHFRLASSNDGVSFQVEEHPALVGQGSHEAFGLEDGRVSEIDGVFYITYSAVSIFGVGVGLTSTTDWRSFTRHGIIIPPHNKDCALFPEKINGTYVALHRPSGVGLGGNNIWIARSPDLLHWGRHECIAVTRPDMWDSERIGAGASPVRTPEGWLEIYHGADDSGRYCLGALLLDLEDPGRVLARSQEPIMEPSADYELSGMVGNVVFTNGHLVDGDEITIYYGASDSVICGAKFSTSEILTSLG